MDLKMGTRTFKDSECSSLKPRKDLLDKMLEIDPNEPTEEERRVGITKLRYMTFREKLSSSASMGFRFDGVRAFGPSGPDQEEDVFVLNKKDTTKIATREQIQSCLRRYLNGRPDVQAELLARLVELREALRGSDWFASHDMIGSSLLFVYDRSLSSAGCTTGVWMIDFANTHPLCPPVPCGEGREDGYLFGLDNLIAVWQTL